MSGVLGSKLMLCLRGKAPQRAADLLKGKQYILLYLGNHSEERCRDFAPSLAAFHDKHGASKQFTVVYVPMETSEADWQAAVDAVPSQWLSYSFEDALVSGTVWMGDGEVEELPAVLVLNNCTDEVSDVTAADVLLTRRGAERILTDPEAVHFPWSESSQRENGRRAGGSRGSSSLSVSRAITGLLVLSVMAGVVWFVWPTQAVKEKK